MAKDKAYAEHQKAMEQDRPKDFGLEGDLSVAEYVLRWCVHNGLKHNAEAEAMKKKIAAAKRRKRTAGPKARLP